LEKWIASEEDVQTTKQINKAWAENPSRKIKEMLWIMPDFTNVYNGGPHTILRFANFFAESGIHNTIVVMSAAKWNERSLRKSVSKAFPNCKNMDFLVYPYWKEMEVQELPNSDVAVATIWFSAYPLLRYHRTKAKYYFVQDYEPLFYPAGIEYGLAAATYDFGFYCICNTEGVFRTVAKNHEIQGTYFTPAADAQIFFPKEERNSLTRIFFYARPGVPRNGFELGIAGLRLIKSKYPETEIFLAGHYSTDLGLDFEAKILGYLSYQETGELYRYCDAGIAFMFTSHPSYIPPQMMACGCIVIANRNSANRWLLKDGYNCVLCNPTPSGLLEAYTRLREGCDLRKKLRQNGIATVASFSWKEEMSKILAYMTNNSQIPIDAEQVSVNSSKLISNEQTLI
jgi:glycosyltransferase involved in cell wall biosynthesis